MPHSQSSALRSHSPNSSDTENHPIFDKDTPPDELLKIARQYQIESNTAKAQAKRLSRKLADITNDDDDGGNDDDNDNIQFARNKRRRTTAARSTRFNSDGPDGEGSDDTDVDDDAIQQANEQFLSQAGHKFFLLNGPWIRSDEEIFDQKVDDKYKPEERFENDQNKVQGQIREIIALVQERFQWSAFRQKWARREFMLAFKAQRYNTANRLRQQCASVLGVLEQDMLRSEDRRMKFREEIGWVSTSAKYSAVDVPLLHEKWEGQYSLSSVFLNRKLMGVYVALIRGPGSAKHFMKGRLYYPQSASMARIHGIRHTTPGAIATCAILARWTLSGDESLQEIGSNTGINYLRDYEDYLDLLETGLRQKKKSILNVFKQWDTNIFPDSDSSIVGGRKKDEHDVGADVKRARQLLEADEEEEEESRADN